MGLFNHDAGFNMLSSRCDSDYTTVPLLESLLLPIFVPHREETLLVNIVFATKPSSSSELLALESRPQELNEWDDCSSA